ncbi:hypothetical protein CsNV_026 [Callinectes sapidus nudivirus]|nr:hypothetical protein CsNV_026 [Callinectes sapidus nudivirus]
MKMINIFKFGLVLMVFITRTELRIVPTTNKYVTSLVANATEASITNATKISIANTTEASLANKTKHSIEISKFINILQEHLKDRDSHNEYQINLFNVEYDSLMRKIKIDNFKNDRYYQRENDSDRELKTYMILSIGIWCILLIDVIYTRIRDCCNYWKSKKMKKYISNSISPPVKNSHDNDACELCTC